MVKSIMLLCACIALTLSPLCLAGPRKGGGGGGASADLPEAVTKCINQRYPDAAVNQFEEQTEQGRHMFFVAITPKDGKAVTVLCAGRGQYLGQLTQDADADNVDLDLDTAPESVKQAIKKHFGATEVDGLSMEVEASRFVYIADQTTNDITQWVSFSLQGEVISIEREVPMKDVLAAVKTAITTARPHATLTSASEVNDQEKKSKEFVVDVTDGKEKLEITVSPDGKIKTSEPADENDAATSKP